MANIVKAILAPLQEGLSHIPFINGRRNPYTQEEEFAHKERVAGYQGEIQRNKNTIKEIELGAEVMVTEVQKKEAISRGKTKILEAQQEYIEADGKRAMTEIDTRYLEGKTQHEVKKKTGETFFKLKEMNWHSGRKRID